MSQTEKKLQKQKREGLVLLGAGLFLCAAELWKQLYLYFCVFGRQYRVWYLPWQLCSMPLYLSTLYGALRLRAVRQKRTDASAHFLSTIAAFLSDYGMLGGIAALIVPAGFTFPSHPLLTLHGYVWHITLILLSLYIAKHRLSDSTKAGFLRTLPLFFCFAAVAEALNLSLHRFGDCDMFYISPYHLSAQPVFSDIDRLIGRIPGILCYLLAVIAGAALVHFLLGRLFLRPAMRQTLKYPR